MAHSGPMTDWRKARLPVIAFLAPATIIYTLFMIYPLVDSIRLSFYATPSGGEAAFVGLDNYRTVLADPDWAATFWNSFWNNMKFFAVHMLIQNPIGIALAGILSLPRLRFRNSYRTMMIMPTMLSVVIVGFIWQLILSPVWGVGADLLDIIGLKSLFGPWLGKEGSALITLSFISVWQWVGIPLMLIYAALLAIPDDLVDAAVVDGATHFEVFWHIKLPLVFPTVAMVSILTFVGNFNAFDLIYAVKGALAGPNFATDIMGTLFYRTFFGYQLQLGNPHLGATVASLMFLIILAGVLFYLFAVQRRLSRYQL
ncbi:MULTISPECIES: carbohydrate ABC transporter permease [Thalassospira]|jgi:raffinose/stachyose/melibiose transport system permease protein|uniref:Sugar ABC transporter permease n=3 Tax=Thalassospira TaxID=168934 RepID=A0A3D5N7P3_9PROT|nr:MULTISPECIES: sugar ABC transporter permease [Thalassospira]PKR59402.1 ABC transporter permease [Thalassospira lohafexi]HCW67451.1 sugar ABC transporter permease [Thalassospira lucentensis]|tara:strand:- start:1566 stop:2504 length:939 start_codon:yes stop_codon:yes gene_type:complete